MHRRFRGWSAWMVVPLVLAMVETPVADAAGGRGGHGGGGGHRSAPRPPSHASMQHSPAPRAARMPHNTSASHSNSIAPHNNSATHGNSVARSSTTPHNNSVTNSTAVHNSNGTRSNGSTHVTNPNNTMSLASRIATSTKPSTYAYGTGSSTRHYRPSGYGRGYRNRYYGNSRNYGQSQSNTRALVSRLRSVHSTLTRIDHDYNGHRARAAHEIKMAIRSLSHNSGYSNMNGSSGRSNTRMTGLNGAQNQNGLNGTRRQNQNVIGNGNGNRNGQGLRMSQAQSDTLMSQALRTTQGISMQLSNQGQSSGGHRHAHARLQRSMHEMNIALATR